MPIIQRAFAVRESVLSVQFAFSVVLKVISSAIVEHYVFLPKKSQRGENAGDEHPRQDCGQADSVGRNWMLPSASAVAGLAGHSSLFCR